MYRICCFCSVGLETHKLKMYWNKRLNEWTFNKPSLVSFRYAFNFITDQYLNKDHVETANPYNYYYIYSIEKI